jgi:hypothetical protein|tara:strand:+ start:1215 stop:1454 length:240 start_codon:yes stop_codon:yes gene_type:complete
MAQVIRLEAEEARRLKNDTAFQRFVENVRKDQMKIFAESSASDVDVREEAHSIVRALNEIEITLDAAISAELILDKQRK